MPASAIAKVQSIVEASSRPAERRWHPALRAVSMVGLGALAWLPVLLAGRLIFS